MNPVLRTSDGHLLTDDVGSPVLDEDAEHHLTRVLRLRDGATVTVTDGRGAWRACRLDRGLLVADGEVTVESSAPEATIASAIPKGDRLDWMVQKLTELGIARIQLLRCERSVVVWDGGHTDRQMGRLERIAVAALQQSRGVWMPAIEAPVAAVEVLPQMPVAEPGGDRLAVGATTVAIGPEGGWSESELVAAGGMVDLGAGVLRVETAAVTAGVLLTRGQR